MFYTFTRKVGMIKTESKGYELKKQIDARRLIADLGGTEVLAQRMRDAGIQISVKAVEKWRERNKVPMPRWLEITSVVKKAQGRTLVLEDYLVEAQ